MTNDNNDLLRQYLDGELSGEEERSALRHIAEDPEQRALLRMELNLREAGASERQQDTGSFAVPTGFTDEVMSDITSSETHAKTRRYGFIHRIRDFLKPRTITLRPVPTFAAAAIALIVLVATPVYYLLQVEQAEEVPMQLVDDRTHFETDEDEQLWMRFVYVSEEPEEVAVAGDFSDWEEIPLTQENLNGDVVWTGVVPVTRGEHRYMFVKDGEEWVTDPLAESYRDDGFGNKNAILKL